MLRRPSHFVTASNIISRQDLDEKRKGDDENTTISVASLQDDTRSRKQKSDSKGYDKKSERSASESKSVSLKEIKKHPLVEQIKKDILDYLDSLIEKTEWLDYCFILKIDT